MATNNYYNSSTSSSSRMRSIYRMSDAQPNWAQTDPEQPDYIKNKELAEKFRPVSVNGQEILDDSYASGNLNIVSGDNVEISTEGNSVKISAIPSTDSVRPVYVNGQEVLDSNSDSGELNLVGGNNVILRAEGNTITISAKSSGGGSGDSDCPEYVEGEGIDIIENEYGQRVVSIEDGSISNDKIESISIDKIVQPSGTTLILNGGSIDG